MFRPNHFRELPDRGIGHRGRCLHRFRFCHECPTFTYFLNCMRLANKGTQNRFFRTTLILALSVLILSSCASARKAAHEKQVDTLIDAARSYYGTPYKYGGTTRAGMDCSAFTSAA